MRERRASTKGRARFGAAPAGSVALVILASSGGASAQAPPAFRHDAFSSRTAHVTAERRSIALLDDGCLDLRVIQQHGYPALLLLQPGTVLLKNENQVDAAASAFEQLSAFEENDLAALALGIGADERPFRLVGRAPLVAGRPCFVRTIRRELGGGGALARVRCTGASAPGAPLAVDLAIDVLPLDPNESLLPRREDAWYEQDVGLHEEIVELFPVDPFGHPSLSTYDVLRLDRDHLEWSGVVPREPLLPPGQFTSRGLGFERVVEFTEANVGRNPYLWRVRDRKADALGLAKSAEVVVVNGMGEPIHGAWVCTRRAMRRDETSPALFSVQSDEDGNATLPLDLQDDPATVEVLAFRTGAKARFGTRRGAVVAAGGGGECVVVLDQDATTSLSVSPPPGRSCFVGLQIATGSFLVKLDRDGRVELPALGETCAITVGPPYVTKLTTFELTPGASRTVEGTLAAGRERRVRFVDPRDGTSVPRFELSGPSVAGLVKVEDGVLVPPELAGAPVAFDVAAPGFRRRHVELAANAPRDQDLPLETE